MQPRALAFLAFLAIPACSPRAASFDGPTGKLIAAAADRNGVPRELMAAVAQVEGGLRLAPIREVHDDEAIPVAGVLELRHGRFDSLARGAELLGVPQGELIRDLEKGTEAGARVLAELGQGIAWADLAAWAPAVETLSGHLSVRDRQVYRAKVFRLLRAGFEARARGGEIIALPPHDEIPVALTLDPPALGAQGMAEFAGATWFPTPQANKWSSGRGGYPVTMIAIHDTEGGWDASVATLQNDSGKSVHYIIDADGGQVGQFVLEADTAWHAGNFYYNQHMVGIEHVGYASDDAYQTPMYEKSAELVRDIAKRQGLGPNGDGSALDRSVLVGHQEVPDGTLIPSDSPPCPDSPGSCTKDADYGGANNHRDPGVHWNWCQYAEIIGNGASCKCNDAYTHFNCTLDRTEAFKCADGATVEVTHCASASCTVEPIGVDDQCGMVASSSSSSGAGGSGTTTAAGGAGGAGGEGGAGGAKSATHHETSGAGGSAKSAGDDSGCSIGAAPSERELGWGLGLLAAASVMARRRGAGKRRGPAA